MLQGNLEEMRCIKLMPIFKKLKRRKTDKIGRKKEKTMCTVVPDLRTFSFRKSSHHEERPRTQKIKLGRTTKETQTTVEHSQ